MASVPANVSSALAAIWCAMSACSAMAPLTDTDIPPRLATVPAMPSMTAIALGHLRADVLDLKLDTCCRRGGLDGQCLTSCATTLKPRAGFPGPRCLDRGIEREQIGLAGNPLDHPHHIADARRRVGQFLYRVIGSAGIIHGAKRHVGNVADLAGNLVDRSGQLVDREGDAGALATVSCDELVMAAVRVATLSTTAENCARGLVNIPCRRGGVTDQATHLPLQVARQSILGGGCRKAEGRLRT